MAQLIESDERRPLRRVCPSRLIDESVGDGAGSGGVLPRPAAASRLEELEAAIASVTRLLAHVEDPKDAAGLVAQRKAMREELNGLCCEVAGVVDIRSRRR